MKAGHTDIVEALIEGEADMDTPTKGNYTPLFVAVMQGHSKTPLPLILRAYYMSVQYDGWGLVW